jgi:hypothetical protein
LRSAIDGVAEEQEFSVRKATYFAGDSEQTVKLDMDVADDMKRRRKLNKQ